MKIYRKSKVTAATDLTGLDDRYSFDFEELGDSISLNTTASQAEMFLEDSEVMDAGVGMEYTVIIAIPRDADHWQMQNDIQRNLQRHVEEVVEGSDYVGTADVTESHVTSYSVPDDIADNCVLYRAVIDVVPYQNISPWGDMGIDYGTEEYFDHVTKGTPFPPEY